MSVSVPLLLETSEQPLAAPVQALPRNSRIGSNPPVPVTWIVGFTEVATNRYQTSRAWVLVKPLHVLGATVCVASTVVPEVATQVAFWVSVMTPAQSLLAG